MWFWCCLHAFVFSFPYFFSVDFSCFFKTVVHWYTNFQTKKCWFSICLKSIKYHFTLIPRKYVRYVCWSTLATLCLMHSAWRMAHECMCVCYSTVQAPVHCALMLVCISVGCKPFNGSITHRSHPGWIQRARINSYYWISILPSHHHMDALRSLFLFLIPCVYDYVQIAYTYT